MMPLQLLAKAAVYGVLAFTLTAAVSAVTRPNIFHAALSLVVTLIGVAALYLALHAEFIAVVQVLLYVGAVMTLLIFAIMLTHRIGSPNVPQANRQSLPALLTLAAFVGLVGSLILKTNWTAIASVVAPGGGPRVDTLVLGKALLGEYVFPFEVVSIVLVGGLIGAVVMARKD